MANTKKKDNYSCNRQPRYPFLGFCLLLSAAFFTAAIFGFMENVEVITETFNRLGVWQYFLPILLLVLGCGCFTKREVKIASNIIDIDKLRQQDKLNAERAAEEQARAKEKEKAAQQNVYDDEEFADFAQGIKSTSRLKKFFGFGKDGSANNSNIGTEASPETAQPPDWLNEPRTGGEAPAENTEPGIEPAPINKRAEKNDRSRVVKNNSGSGVITNFYNKGYTGDDDVLKVAASNKETPWNAVPQTYDDNKDISKSNAEDEQTAKEKSKTTTKKSAETTNDENEEAPAKKQTYLFPPIELLDKPHYVKASLFENDIRNQCIILEQTLADFRVKAKVTAVTRGPSVTRFELEPAPGVKVASVVNLADDIALRLAAPSVRIEAPIPGKSAIGVEVPNVKNDSVCLREVVDSEAVRNASKLCVGLGKDISGNLITIDLAKMPHLLVAGSTGSGKSVCINTLIAGILYKARPDEVKLILVDPKVVELTNYDGIPHLLTPVVTEPKKAASALHWAVAEMERRYLLFAESRVKEIESYNQQATEQMHLPYIVIVIDELSDLMMVAKVDVEDAILRLAQKARAAGIHLVIATQRPSVDVITGIVKANIPSRIAFAVSSQTDSRTILDMGGAEKLLGKGDMLICPIGHIKPLRVQGAFVSDRELMKIVEFIIKQSIPPEYSEEVTNQPLESDSKDSSRERDESEDYPNNSDELFEDAVRLVLDMGQASSSMLQRRFRIGYTRAARLVDNMEELGIVSQASGSKPREVIMSRQEVEERFLSQDNNG